MGLVLVVHGRDVEHLADAGAVPLHILRPGDVLPVVVLLVGRLTLEFHWGGVDHGNA